MAKRKYTNCTPIVPNETMKQLVASPEEKPEANGCTALVAVERAIQKVVPPPKKSDVLKATAQAMYQEQQAAVDAAQKEINEAYKALTAAVKALVTLPKGVAAEARLSWGDKVVLEVAVPKSFSPEICKLFERHAHLKQASGNMRTHTPEQFLKALRERSANNGHTVDALLADKDIKAKLLAMGRELLRRPSADDRKTAIAV